MRLKRYIKETNILSKIVDNFRKIRNKFIKFFSSLGFGQRKTFKFSIDKNILEHIKETKMDIPNKVAKYFGTHSGDYTEFLIAEELSKRLYEIGILDKKQKIEDFSKESEDFYRRKINIKTKHGWKIPKQIINNYVEQSRIASKIIADEMFNDIMEFSDDIFLLSIKIFVIGSSKGKTDIRIEAYKQDEDEIFKRINASIKNYKKNFTKGVTWQLSSSSWQGFVTDIFFEKEGHKAFTTSGDKVNLRDVVAYEMELSKLIDDTSSYRKLRQLWNDLVNIGERVKSGEIEDSKKTWHPLYKKARNYMIDIFNQYTSKPENHKKVIKRLLKKLGFDIDHNIYATFISMNPDGTLIRAKKRNVIINMKRSKKFKKLYKVLVDNSLETNFDFKWTKSGETAIELTIFMNNDKIWTTKFAITSQFMRSLKDKPRFGTQTTWVKVGEIGKDVAIDI